MIGFKKKMLFPNECDTQCRLTYEASVKMKRLPSANGAFGKVKINHIFSPMNATPIARLTYEASVKMKRLPSANGAFGKVKK